MQRMRSFTHLMPGEVQGCVGCHEPRQQTPPRPLPLAALAREPQDLRPPEWGVQGFCYAADRPAGAGQALRRVPQPLTKDGGIDLSGDRTDYFNVSYEMLARREPGPDRQPVRELDPDLQRPGMEHPGDHAEVLGLAGQQAGRAGADRSSRTRTASRGCSLDEPQRRRILMWIDLNVPYYGTADTAHPDLPGCRQMYPAGPDAGDGRRLRPAVRRSATTGSRQTMAKGWTPRTSRWRGEHGRADREPELNDFLLAPLAKSAGGTGSAARPCSPRPATPTTRPC